MKFTINIFFIILFGLNCSGQNISLANTEDGTGRKYFVMRPVGNSDKPYSYMILSPDSVQVHLFGSLLVTPDVITEDEYGQLRDFIKHYYYTNKDTNLVWNTGEDHTSLNTFAIEFFKSYDKVCSNCYCYFMYENKEILFGYTNYTDKESKEHIDALIEIVKYFVNGDEIVSGIREVYNERYVKKGFELK